MSTLQNRQKSFQWTLLNSPKPFLWPKQSSCTGYGGWYKHRALRASIGQVFGQSLASRTVIGQFLHGLVLFMIVATTIKCWVGEDDERWLSGKSTTNGSFKTVSSVHGAHLSGSDRVEYFMETNTVGNSSVTCRSRNVAGTTSCLSNV